MRSRIGAGLVAGLAGGLVLALALALMQTPRMAGDQPSILLRVARLAGSESIAVSWALVAVAGAVLGAVLAALLGRRAHDFAVSTLAALVWAGVLWVAMLIVAPMTRGDAPFSALMSLDSVAVALGSLLALLLYGSILGLLLPWLLSRR